MSGAPATFSPHARSLAFGLSVQRHEAACARGDVECKIAWARVGAYYLVVRVGPLKFSRYVYLELLIGQYVYLVRLFLFSLVFLTDNISNAIFNKGMRDKVLTDRLYFRK